MSKANNFTTNEVSNFTVSDFTLSGFTNHIKEKIMKAEFIDQSNSIKIENFVFSQKNQLVMSKNPWFEEI